MFRQLSIVFVVVLLAFGSLAILGCSNQVEPMKQDRATQEPGVGSKSSPVPAVNVVTEEQPAAPAKTSDKDDVADVLPGLPGLPPVPPGVVSDENTAKPAKSSKELGQKRANADKKRAHAGRKRPGISPTQAVTPIAWSRHWRTVTQNQNSSVRRGWVVSHSTGSCHSSTRNTTGKSRTACKRQRKLSLPIEPRNVGATGSTPGRPQILAYACGQGRGG